MPCKLLALALASLTLAGARPEDDFAFRGTGWVNSKDISLDRLKGKVVVLFFYEEC